MLHTKFRENEIFNICKISFNKRYLLHTYILLCTITTFQKIGTCLEAQQSMAKHRHVKFSKKKCVTARDD